MKTKWWLLIIGALLAVCAVLSVLFLLPGQADFVQVYSDGKLLYTLNLNQDQTRTVESAYGTNEITVRDGKVAVTRADCPDGYCMARGFCGGGTQIVCLPNRLVLRFVSDQEVDAAVG